MVTAIGSTGLNAALNAVRGNTVTKNGAAKNAPATEITSGASLEVARMVTSGAPIEVEKVAAIKAALANGTYTVNPQAIADKMIADDLPLPQQK